jgi:hypothetical protein
LRGFELGPVEITWRVKLKGSGASSSLVGASLLEDVADDGLDMIDDDRS